MAESNKWGIYSHIIFYCVPVNFSKHRPDKLPFKTWTWGEGLLRLGFLHAQMPLIKYQVPKMQVRKLLSVLGLGYWRYSLTLAWDGKRGQCIVFRKVIANLGEVSSPEGRGSWSAGWPVCSGLRGAVVLGFTIAPLHSKHPSLDNKFYSPFCSEDFHSLGLP